MKILAILSTLDLQYRLGCTPAWWQLLKALHEIEVEVVAVPYLGKSIETLWWRSEPNPWQLPGGVYHRLFREIFQKKSGGHYRTREALTRAFSKASTRLVWDKHLRRILGQERDVDAVVFFNVPLNQINGIPTSVSKEFGIKTVFYDGDMPTVLPEHNPSRGFIFDYYRGANLDEFDLVFVNSEGVIPQLEQIGARRIQPLHYAADPELFQPVDVEKQWDVAFFGYGSQQRERWMNAMISEPSLRMQKRFAVGGKGFQIKLGNAHIHGDVPTSRFSRFCCSSKINLNITRESHTSVYASSTARPFELASMGCCIVSCPYSGLEKWFVPNREIVILEPSDSAGGIYENLLADDNMMTKMGEAARKRLLREHTYKHRATQMVRQIMDVNQEGR